MQANNGFSEASQKALEKPPVTPMWIQNSCFVAPMHLWKSNYGTHTTTIATKFMEICDNSKPIY
jgi:hypothetical protein